MIVKRDLDTVEKLKSFPYLCPINLNQDLIRIVHILLMSLVLCLSGCQGSHWFEDNMSLDYIDSLFAENKYAEAYNVVISIDSLMVEKSYGVRMRFELQKIKAEDKIRKPLLTDSIILPIIDYYETEGDKRYLPEAYYYSGRTYYTLHDYQRATEFLNKALDVVPENDNYLLSRIHSQRGYIMYDNGLYDEAIKEHLRSYDYSLSDGDTVAMIHNYRDIGNSYLGKDEYSDALSYYERGVQLASLANDSAFIGLIGIDKASAYTYMGDLEMAEKYVIQSINLVDSLHFDYANSIAGYLYFKQRKYDVAKSYYKPLLHSHSLFYRQDGEAMLLSMAANEKNLEETLRHLVPYKDLTDSISLITNSEKIARINSLYNSRRLERQKDELEKRNIRYTYYIIIGGLLLSSIMATFFTYYYRARSERNRLKFNNAMLDQYLKEEQQRRALVEKERDRLVEANLMEKLKQEQGDERKNAIRESAIYLKLLESAKGMSPIDREAVEDLLNLVYPDFFTRLHSLGVIKEHELDVCMLVKMGFNPSRIALLLSHSLSAITNTRKKLYEKVKGKQGKASDWDEIVCSL